MTLLLLLSIVLGIVAAFGLALLILVYRKWHMVPLAGLAAWAMADAILAARAGQAVLGGGPSFLRPDLEALSVVALALLAVVAIAWRARAAAWGGPQSADTRDQVQQMIDALPALVGYVGADRRYALVNRRLADYLGRAESDLVGRVSGELFPADDAAALEPHMDAALDGRDHRFRICLRFPRLGPRLLEVAFVPDKETASAVRGFFVLAHDISEAERAERALIESEQRFRDLTGIASDWFWETDQEGRFSYISSRMQEVTGIPTTSLLGLRLRDLSDRVSPGAHWHDLEAALEAHRPFRNLIFKRHLPDGRHRVLQTSGKPVFGPEGEFKGYRGVCSDITEEEALVERRAQAELRFATAIESVPEAFALYDREDRLVSCNRTHRAFYETPGMPDDAVGRGFEEMVRGFAEQGGVAGSEGEADAWVAARLKRREAPAHRFRFPSRDGVWLEVTDFLLPDDTVITITADATAEERADQERRAHETEVAQVQRRSIMGEMAAMLAHELSQPLSAVVNYAAGSLGLIRASRLSPDEAKQALERIRYEAGRASEMLRGIGAFLANTELESETIDVEGLFETVELLAQPELQAGRVQAGFKVEPNLPRLQANRIEIEQVLLNLIRNAVEAVQDVAPAERRIDIQASLAAPGKLAVTISDNGKGIPAEVGSAAFNAFFTTKSDGLGMGLTISRRIAQGHGGNLRIVSSDPGKTTLCLTLPLDGLTHGDDLRAA